MCMYRYMCMTDSTKNAKPTKSTKSRNSKSSVQIQINPTSQFEFVQRDTEKSEFLDLADLGEKMSSVETVIYMSIYIYIHVYIFSRTCHIYVNIYLYTCIHT